MAVPAAHPLAVVTGASSGIGYALAEKFATESFDLIIAAEDPGVQAAAAALSGHGVTVIPVQVDLATCDGVERLYDTLGGATPDVVAINAGVGVSGDFARDNDLAAELNLINLNVRSTVHLAKRVLQLMVPVGRGKLLFTSSIAAFSPGPYEATYAASKAFILSFAEAIRHELLDTGITVTAVLPGPTETRFFERAGMQDTKLGAVVGKDDPADVAREAFDAVMGDKDMAVVGSARNKAQQAAARLMPQQAQAKAHAKLSEPGSAEG